MYKRSPRGWAKHIDFILLDLLSLHVSFVIAYWIRNGFGALPYGDARYRVLSLVMTIVDVVVAVLLSTFNGVLRRGYYKEIAATIKHAATVFAVLTYYLFLLQSGDQYSRIFFVVMMIIYALIGYSVRIVYRRLRRTSKGGRRSLLIIATESGAGQVAAALKSGPDKYAIAGIAVLDSNIIGKSIENIPVVAASDTVIDYVSKEWIDEAFIHLPKDHLAAEELIEKLTRMGVVVHVSIDPVFGISAREQIVENVGGYTVVTSSLTFATPLQVFLKRTLDIIGGIAGCIAAAFICLFIAPFLLKESPGPLFFVQERVGINGKRFKMYKIRSMYLDAEERKQELQSQNRVNDGMMFKLDWDPRIIGNKTLPDGTRKTGIGHFIRKTSLDEFPQFFNVLRGDMSLVGTRPPTVDEWKKYQLHHHARLAVKPGITGMWQVSGRSEITDFEEVVKLDTQYIYDWSPGLDLRILLKTFSAVFKKNGAM